MAKIKICGLSRSDDISFVNNAGCDYVGFVFAESKRKITLEQGIALKKILLPNICSVGVFADNEFSYIEEICKKGIIDIVQLHGSEDNKFIQKVKSALNKPVIKSFSVKGEEDILAAESSVADYILFDAYSAVMKGGTGKTFNWDLLKGFKGEFFLAGGLDLTNISLAYSTLRPLCFDVSSGAETCGVKDKNKIDKIVNLVRSLR